MKKSLIVVDVQNDFLEGGNLEVKDSNKIIPVINDMIVKGDFDYIIFTKDWHPSDHKSFASQYENKNVFDVINLNGIQQVLWPEHCIQNTPGSYIHNEIIIGKPNSYIFKKGMNPNVDSYSAFYDNDHKSSTGLSEFLKSKDVTKTVICGLAMDFCVKYTAIDSVNEGFDTTLVLDATQSIDNDKGSHLEEMKNNGISFEYSEKFIK
ncbi:MAG: bifunctional nicotinamidase/pyrazinamidase [Saccharofermentanales bacterium]